MTMIENKKKYEFDINNVRSYEKRTIKNKLQYTNARKTQFDECSVSEHG